MMSRPVRITTEAVETNIRLARELENKRRNLDLFAKENNNLISAAKAQTKIELQRSLAQQQNNKTELIFDENLRRNDYQRKFRELTISQNQALATELDKDTADDERRRREIQKICEEAPELKELEAMLKLAYSNKERAAQLDERILLANREQERIQAIEDQMEEDRLNAIKAESLKEQKKKLIFDDQRVVLQKQISEKRAQLAEARQLIEKEKEMVNEVVSRINAEDEANAKARRDKQLATAQMVRNFEEQRKRELEAARAAAKAEEDRIMSYNKAVEARTEGVAAKKMAKRDEEDRLLRQIVEETERKHKAQEEFIELRDMLWEEELEEKRAEEARDRAEKQRVMREQMMDANGRMVAAKKEQRRLDMEGEMRLVALMREKFLEDEARDRALEVAQRNSRFQYQSQISMQKEERKNMYEREREQESAQRDEMARREQYRLQVIQEARKRLLEEHASKLAGYIPMKAYSNKEEYEAVLKAGSNKY